MNTKPIGNLRAITVAMIVAITVMGVTFVPRANAVVPCPNSGALPGSTGVPFNSSRGCFSILATTPSGGSTTVTVRNDNEDGARILRVQEFLKVKYTISIQSLSISDGEQFGKGVHSTFLVITITIQVIHSIRVFELDGNGNLWVFAFDVNPDGSIHVQVVPQRMWARGSSANILIHEFNDETTEATAFDAGTLDLMDWPPPSTFVNTWTQPGGLVATNKASLSKFIDIGMFQIDINSWNAPTSNKALRQAVGYLVDRQQVVNVFAGGLAVPICAGTAAGQPGAKSCTQLGYPTSFGEFSSSKAIQVLYEGGWRDNDNDGILEAPGGASEPTLIFYVRQDDSIRRQAGDQLTQALLHLPKSFISKAGPVQTVCAATAECKINMDERVLPRAQIAPIVFRGTGSKLWNLYTGGWGLGFDPDHIFYLYTTGYAWSTCGGGWLPNTAALNYPCNVDAAFDAIAQPMVTGATYNDVLASAQASQQYAWGYASGKITGTMPTVPIYSRQAEAVGYNTDVGAGAIAGAHWKGYIGQEIGSGLGQIVANTAGASLYNGQTGGAGYVSYRGQGVMDWGFKSQVQQMNIVLSEWLWDLLTMQQTYDACLGRNPVKQAEIVPSMCVNFGQTTVFNTALGIQTTVAVYKFQDGLYFSNGNRATCADFKFSIEYVQANFGFQSSLVADVVKVDCVDSLTAVVYFDGVGALFMQSAGFLPIIEKKLWCNSWPNLVADCAYPTPDLFPDFDFSKHVGTGPYVISSCTGVDCSETITLSPNPYYSRGLAFLDVADSIQVQPDVNRDDRINNDDLVLLQLVAADDPTFDVDYRIQVTKSATYTSTVGPGTFTVAESGPLITNTDKYIINRLINEGITLGGDPAGLVWPPAHTRLTHHWPDATRDNSVDLDDVISVFLHQFQDPKVISANSINDVDYSGDISLDDLIIAFVRQFTKPVGMP